MISSEVVAALNSNLLDNDDDDVMVVLWNGFDDDGENANVVLKEVKDRA